MGTDEGWDRAEAWASVDGVPYVWMDTPGRSVGCLLFRVGYGDEPIARRGVTHLIEHLALGTLRDRRPGDVTAERCNGFTGPVTTGFVASGTAEELASFFSDLTAILSSDLLWERAERERRVLLAEAERTGTANLVGAMCVDLIGANGPARGQYSELGLIDDDLGPARAWRDHYFTAGNAVLWATAPPTPSSSLRLAEGPRRPAPEVSPLIATPAYTRRPGAVGFVGLAGRSTELAAGIAIAANRIGDALREGAGVSYGAESVYVPVSGVSTIAGVVADVRTDWGSRAVEVTSCELDRLVSEGPTAEELDRHRHAVLLQRQHEGWEAGWLSGVAETVLHGRPMSTDGYRAELERLAPAPVAAVLGDVRRGSVWTVPNEADVSWWVVEPVPELADPPLEGRSCTPTTPGRQGRLVVAEEGLWMRGRSASMALRWEDVVALERFGDGGRVLLRGDGSSMLLRPGEWKEEAEVRDVIDSKVDCGRWVEAGFRSAMPVFPTVSEVPAPRSRAIAIVITVMMVGTLLLLLLAGSPSPAGTEVGPMVFLLAFGGLVVGATWYATLRERPLPNLLFDAAQWNASGSREADPASELDPYRLGGHVLHWAIARRLVRPAVVADIERQALPPGAPAAASYRAVGGILASDMLEPTGIAFLRHLWTGQQEPVVRQPPVLRMWDAVGGPTGGPDAESRFSAALDSEFQRWLARRPRSARYDPVVAGPAAAPGVRSGTS